MARQIATRTNQKGYGMLSSLVGIIFGFIIGVLVLRFVFRLLGANPDASFVAWIYSWSAPLVAPFFGIFNHTVDLATGRLEFETLIAIIVYGFIASVIQGVTSWGGRRRPV
ncbi:MAG: hypothetical protein JWR85_3642 [Marmoricola sp.]|nr:hypothetical protein [Marmoricola sp.]